MKPGYWRWCARKRAKRTGYENEMVIDAIYLKPGREKSVKQRHPWIFSGAVARVQVTPEKGSTVEVFSAGGELLGRAAYSPESNIRARMWTGRADERVDIDFFHARVQRAIDLRQCLAIEANTNAYRLVYAESDGLPGLIVDRYGPVLVVQSLTAGSDYWLTTLVGLLVEHTGAQQVFERSDVDVRALEGLPERVGPLYGPPPPPRIEVAEHGLRFWADLQAGQKTGFYLDQRPNRQRVREMVAGREVLNCFAYSGAFTAYALAGGAEQVLSIDSSAEALALGKENLALNGLPAERAEWLEADVFQALRTLRDQGRCFDAIILDPPKFAPTAAQAQRAARGYKDINLLAFKLLRPGGLLFTFSCSGGVSAELFQKIVAGAALDARVAARIVERLSQGPDHPVALNFPEGAYLKGLVCEVG
jgi:23S rRNA (cytosine1962-C5)-methyltransferase